MDEATLKALTASMETTVDAALEKGLESVVTPAAEKAGAKAAKEIVEKMRKEQSLFGVDSFGLSADEKSQFLEAFKEVAGGHIKSRKSGYSYKAGEAIIGEVDNRGGLLVSTEVENIILRIAASVGLVLSQATRWSMSKDEKQIPAYNGSFLEGEFLGIDAPGTVTPITFAQANLITKKWQLAFAVSRDILDDADVAIVDWLFALAGEAMANMVDKQALAGTGAPFVGVLNYTTGAVTPTVYVQTANNFAGFDPVLDGSDVIGNIDESVLDGAVWAFHRSVWAKIRSRRDAANAYILPLAGAVSAGVLANYSKTVGGARPVGEIMGYPVFTTRHLPANSATAVNTRFGIFGNLKAIAIGLRKEMGLEQYTSGSFGGQEIALADQIGLIFRARVAVTVALPGAFVVIRTAAV
jgi:HK97 family phage major capsid protein